jgi:hypothetical protein
MIDIRRLTSDVLKGHGRILTIGLIAAFAACGGGGSGGSKRSASDTLSERQRDSILAKSSIPGASAVGKAMTAADTMSARVRVSDTVQ